MALIVTITTYSRITMLLMVLINHNLHIIKLPEFPLDSLNYLPP